MSIADSFLQGLQAPLQVPQAGLPMDMTPYVTALPDLKQHEQRVKEQARMQKYIDDMAAKIKKENLDAQDELSFLEGGEKMAFVSSNPWIRRKWLEKVARKVPTPSFGAGYPANSAPEGGSEYNEGFVDSKPQSTTPSDDFEQGTQDSYDNYFLNEHTTPSDDFEQGTQDSYDNYFLNEPTSRDRVRRDPLAKARNPVQNQAPPARTIATQNIMPPLDFLDNKKKELLEKMYPPVEGKVYDRRAVTRYPAVTVLPESEDPIKFLARRDYDTLLNEDAAATPNQIAILEKAKADQERQRYEIDLRNRFMEGRVNDADIVKYQKLLEAEKTRNEGLTVPSNQQLTDRARRNRQQYQRRVQNTLDRATNTGAYKTVGNYFSILPGTTEVTNSPQDLEEIKSRAERLRGQSGVVGARDTGAQFFGQRGAEVAPNPQQFPKLTSDKERQRRELINSRLDLLKPRDRSGNRRFSNDTQRLKNQISSYKPQPQEQSYSEYFSGLGNRLANLGTRLIRPVTTGAQQLASYALDRNMLGLADYVDDDQERLLNASLYHSTGDRDYLTRIKDPRQRVIDAAKPEGYSETAYNTLLNQVRQGTPPAYERRDPPSFSASSVVSQIIERDPSVINRQKQLEQFENFRRFREAQRAAQADFDDRLGDEDFFTKQLVGAQLRPFGNRDQYGDNQRGYFDEAEKSITQAVKNYYGFGRDGGNPPLKEEYSLEGLKSPFRAARREISDLYANPREYLREVALGLDKNNPLAPYAKQLTEIDITPEERAAEMLDMEADEVESSLLPLSMNDSQMMPGGEDYTAANEVMQELTSTPEGQQVARQLLRNINPKLLRIQQYLNSLDPNDPKYNENVNAILSRISRSDLEALDRQNTLIQRAIGQQT